MKVLAIGAHADDVELGCGGTLLKWAGEGHEIVIHVVTDSAYASPDGEPIRSAADAAKEAHAAAARLGARLTIGSFPCFGIADANAATGTALAGLVRTERPEMIMVHWDGDSHADHRTVALATLHAARRVPTVLGYRSNWYPGSRPFAPRVVVDISATLEHKVALIREFKSENGRTGGAWEAQVRRAAESLGYTHGLAAAEGFEPCCVRL